MRPVRSAVGAGVRLVAGRLRGTPPLLSATIYPTQRCNLACTYCSSPLQRTPELSTAQWQVIFDDLAALGCRRIALLGGEPLLRADVAELIDHARRNGLHCTLTSNGLLVPHRVEALRRLDTLVLSLDAPGAANDAVRGTGVFSAVERAIAAARRYAIPVKLNAVLSAPTAPHLDELLGFCERHDLYLTISVVRSGAPDLWRDAARVAPDDAAIAALFAHLAAVARSNRRLLFSPSSYRYAAGWGDYRRDRFEAHELPADDPRRRNGPRCHAGRAYLSIDADGTVYPCALTFGRIRGGNAARDGVASAWRALHGHPCVSCYTPCLVELNSLTSLRPRVLAHFARRHLPRFA